MATLLALPASLIPRAHTLFSALAFTFALAIAWGAGIWEQLCENAVSRWPVEWFPSVSATIGDHAASRAPFQILIALTATPRFALLGLQWLAHRYPPAKSAQDVLDSHGASSSLNEGTARRRTRSTLKTGEVAEETSTIPSTRETSGLADVEAFCGVARTFCCGGWMYITSRDQHDLHDLFMIVYLVLNLPWMALSILHSTNSRAKRWRSVAAAAFMLTIVPLVYWFYQHSVLRVPGAYTYYAFFEWSLVIWDVAFDAGAIFELDHLQVRVIDTSRSDEGSKSGSADALFLAPTPRSLRPRVQDDWTAKRSDTSSIPHRDILAWLGDVWFATAFWTIFTSVSIQLFYWSVWSLSFTGSELAIFINATPYIFNNERYRLFSTSRDGLLTHRLLVYVLGLGCYKIPSVAARFLCAVGAMWCAWCAFMGDSVRLRGSPEMISQSRIYLVGLLITMVCKYSAYSNNPFWPIMDEASGGWNKTGLFISALAVAEQYTRPNGLFASPPIGVKDKPLGAVTSTSTQRLCITLGLGSIVHLLQTFVTDAGTIIAWAWTGYPVSGPMLHPWAAAVIAAAAFGMVANVPTRNPVTWALPFPAAFALVFYQDWIGFVGGLVLVFYIVAVTPTIFRAASALSPTVWGRGMLWNAFLDVASVFTVAYAFVPFGWILRERTDLIMLILLAPLPPALWAASCLDLPDIDQLQPRSVTRWRSTKRWTGIAAVLIAASAVFVGYERKSHTAEIRTPTPYYPDFNIFSGGIFTVHFGIDEPGRCSQRRIAQLVNEMEVDVLGLLETDLHRFVYGNRDLTRYIAEELGYYVDLGPGPSQHTWGAALLSKFPILNSTHHLLPSPNGELAPAIHATLDIRGQHVNVIVSHNGQEEDPLDRELQTTELARLLHDTGDAPTFFLGYLITKQGEKPPSPYGILFNEHTGLIDVETLDTWRWCEYLGFRGLWRVAYSRIEHSDVTDTELQVAKFILPLPGQKALYNEPGELYWHIGEDDVPEPWRMPRIFRDEGVRGHTYRIWDGPLYYNPPAHSGVREYGWEWSTAWPPVERRGRPNNH